MSTDDDRPPLEVDRRHGPGKVPPEVLEQLVANSENLRTEAQLLRSELARIDTDRRTYRVALAAGLVLIIGICAAVGLLLFNSHDAQRQRAIAIQQGRQTKALTEFLVQCTTAPGERKPPVKVTDEAADCFTRNLRQQAAVLGQPAGPLKPYIAISAACGAANPGDYPATRACVTKELQR